MPDGPLPGLLYCPFLGCQRPLKPSPGPVQTHREQAGSDAQRSRRLGSIKPVPGDEQQHLLIEPAQGAKFTHQL